MFTDSHGFIVILEEFAKRTLWEELAGQKAWSLTWHGLEQILARFKPDSFGNRLERLFEYDKDGSIVLYKMFFRLANEHGISAKASGHRLIFVCDFPNQLIRVLMIYHKRQALGSNETGYWKRFLKANYPRLEATTPTVADSRFRLSRPRR